MGTEEKNESFISINAYPGVCRFCGQMHMVRPLMEEASQEEIDEMAAAMCECPDAKAYKRLKESVARAHDNIKTLVEHAESAKILDSAVDPVANGDIAKVTIEDLNGIKYMVQIGKGGIRLTKTTTRKETIE